MNDIARAVLSLCAVTMVIACACRAPEIMTADLAEDVVRSTCAVSPYTYGIETGNPSGCGAPCGDLERKCPWYADFREMGLIRVSCREGRAFVELTPEGLRHIDRYYDGDPLRYDKNRRIFRLADWSFIRVVSVKHKTITRSWTDDAPGADVVYRWKWAPTALGHLFIERGWPRCRLMHPGQANMGTLDTPFEASVELQRYDRTWDRSTPENRGRGGIYVQ